MADKEGVDYSKNPLESCGEMTNLRTIDRATNGRLFFKKSAFFCSIMLPNIVMWFAGSIMPPERVAAFLGATLGDVRVGPYEALYDAFILAFAPFGIRLIYSGIALPTFSSPKTFLNVRAAVTDTRRTNWVMSACEASFENYQESVASECVGFQILSCVASR